MSGPFAPGDLVVVRIHVIGFAHTSTYDIQDIR